jgi:UDP-N-acetyl-D-glucosamine/UDP-N-acetyl-D-galactosamine dehydrogenase
MGFSHPDKIVVVGLGYVGLPLAVHLARHFDTLGFDVKNARVAEILAGRDSTGEIDPATLRASGLAASAEPARLRGREVFIVTVPTPVDAANRPDLDAVRAACRTVGGAMAKGAVVVLESTVYPGVTEDVCGPELESASGLVCGRDFFLGYSPERINPGDREHTVDRIHKIVAGQTPETTERLARIYGAVNGGRIFRARDIKTAEAAKVIENAQRDINIAFVNEIAQIFGRIGVSVHDVLEAAATKWNFLKFQPGLVGGHCIGVDPYYLADLARRVGYHPDVILAGRRVNDAMGATIADAVAKRLAARRGAARARILVLGLTFKENVPDLRNSKVADVVAGLKAWGHAVDVHDPHADPAEAKTEYGIDLIADPSLDAPYDALVAAVAHGEYLAWDDGRIAALATSDGLIADVKGMWRGRALPSGVERWSL